jgi:gliding motility-associated lipoprotein GldD
MASCGSDYYPKPRGYMRIALPEKEYVKFDTTYPFTFEYPVYSQFVPDTDVNAEPYWFNIDFPQFNGQLNVSYKPIDNNVVKYLEDTRTLVMKHIPKANAIESKQFIDKENNIFGLTYSISGTEAASPFQFYLTDSTKNFVRGALYFNTVPNNDSLAPVIDFLKQDIIHMIETFRWKDK